MNKRAQPYDPSEFMGYGQGGLAGYGQGNYDVGLENVGLVPGMEPRVPEQSHMPSIVSPWALPVGLATGGLVGYSLLKRLGRRLASGAARGIATKAAPTAAAPLVSPETEALLKQYAPKQANFIEILHNLRSR